MKKPVCLGLPILELSEILIYEFWYNHVKPKYSGNAKLCYMDTDNFIVYIKTYSICKDIAEDIETRFDTSNYELDRPLPKGKNKKVLGLKKDESSGKIMTKFVGVRANTYSYLVDDVNEDKEVKVTITCVIKRKVKFENYKSCLEATQLDNKINYLEKSKTYIDSLKKDHKEFIKNNQLILKTRKRFKSEKHNVFTVEINKIALSSKSKTMQSIDSIESYSYETSKDLVSEKEEINSNNITKRYKKDNPSWPQNPDHPYNILIIGGFGSGKTNSLFNLINQQPDIDKIHLYAKDPYEAKYQFLIDKGKEQA